MSAGIDVAGALRRQLVRLARWEIGGLLADKSDAWVAGLIRRCAPGLAGACFDEVLDAFQQLCEAVAERDGIRTNAEIWLRDGEDVETEEAVVQTRIDAILFGLVPGGLES